MSAVSLLSVLPVYTHLIFAALLPLITAAFASLRRPINTLSPAQVKLVTAIHRHASDDEDYDVEDETDVEEYESRHSPTENLSASDALLFPLTAGATLGGLYLVIKYFDPTVLSNMLTYYFCLMGVYAVARSTSDILGVVTQIVFPRQYFSKRTGRIYTAGFDRYVSKTATEIENDPNPFGPFGIVGLFPECCWKAVWRFRRGVYTRYCVACRLPGEKGALRRFFYARDLIGAVAGVLGVGGYMLTGKYWLFTNIMGLSFSYGAIQLISPTTFTTATMLLSALFAYDIYFVFFTPLMVTVATSLDIPIKLLFPRPSSFGRMAMLGLGDIVLPGIVIAMALRFDLWRTYEALRRRNIAEMRRLRKEGEEPLDLTADIVLAKPRFRPAMLDWGRKVWGGEVAFGKEYFYAAMGGYVVGMLSTLFGMTWSGRAQPALLYLVPGVLGAIWGCALWRGEVEMVWNYSEETPDEGKNEEEQKEEKDEDEREWDGQETDVFKIIVTKKLLVRQKRESGEASGSESESEGEVVDLGTPESDEVVEVEAE